MKNKKDSLIEQLRAIRDKISLEIKDMNKNEMKNYFKRKKSLFPESKWKEASAKEFPEKQLSPKSYKIFNKESRAADSLFYFANSLISEN
jgi:hypothetical protein